VTVCFTHGVSLRVARRVCHAQVASLLPLRLGQKIPRDGGTLRRLSCFIGIMQSEDLPPLVPTAPLPDNLAACQALIVAQARTIVEQSQKIEEQQLTINELLQRAFRHRSERYLENPN
jgi:hypothetical protein